MMDPVANLKSYLSGIRSKSVDLRPRPLTDPEELPEEELDPHRPLMSIWIDENAGNKRYVTMTVGPLYGHQQRYVEMSTAEARMLALRLNEFAEAVEKGVKEFFTPDPEF
jgi:hypothetical protein